MQHQQHIYTPKNTGPADVFLNGRRIDRVIYADTRRGFVRVIGNPVKLDKHKKRVLWKTLRGDVVVRLKVGAGGTAPEGHNAQAQRPAESGSGAAQS